jgi:hypothetical protein
VNDPRPDLAPPPSGPVWWTGNCRGVGAGCAFTTYAFDARREIARDLGVSPEQVEVVQA